MTTEKPTQSGELLARSLAANDDTPPDDYRDEAIMGQAAVIRNLRTENAELRRQNTELKRELALLNSQNGPAETHDSDEKTVLTGL